VSEGAVAGVVVDAFLIDDDNTEKFARHGIRRNQVAQVLEDAFIVLANKRGHRASHVVIGYDFGGSCLTIPIEGTPEPTVWRPITAWRSAPAERARRDRERRRS
jgi:hypothetical protein